MRLSRRTLLIVGVALAAIVAYRIFPQDNVFQDIIARSMFFVVLPFVCIRFILREPQKEFGVTEGRRTVGIVLAIAALLTMIVATLLMVRFAGDIRESLPQMVRARFGIFVLYHILLAWYALVAGYFYIGFLVLGLRRTFGVWSVAVALLAVAMTNGLAGQSAGAYLSMSLAGIVAYYSRSLYYAWAVLIIGIVAVNGLLVIF